MSVYKKKKAKPVAAITGHAYPVKLGPLHTTIGSKRLVSDKASFSWHLLLQHKSGTHIIQLGGLKQWE